ncbi:YncE family protein [Cystobacter ferrugineus]|uniref:Lipoprotein n=1 Tax=Cystobacter ferrugineus TaxID=83449 RepID=A0A1L9AYE8_9BACT|nr:hypothetical protein [Cystobacter ferrugineus]OJH35039.1 hypothetical protein BON30_41410 [Cystobacter ferrugineus]
MRILLPSLALSLVACSAAEPRPPPTDRFVYPSGIHYRSVAGSTRGILYVSSANFDRCFDQGTVMAVDLDRVGTEGNRLPLLSESSANPAAPVVTLEQLNVPPESQVFIQSYAGELAYWERTDAAPRIFVTARADGDFIHYIDVPEPTRLSCVGSTGNNCIEGALSLTQVSGQTDDLPRAPAPFGVDVGAQGDVWVTHLSAADSPAGSAPSGLSKAFQSYVVRLPGDEPRVSTSDFFSLSIPDLPQGGSNSVVVDERYVFVSGRYDVYASRSQATRRFLLRVLDKNNPGRLIDPGLDLSFAANDSRGLALTARPAVSGAASRRLYMAVRSPDSLLIVNVEGSEGDSPRMTVVGSVPLPLGPTEVELVPRGDGRAELVLISCSEAGVVAIYDPDVGQVVAQVSVGQIRGTESPRPFGLDVQREGNSARIFASNFGDGRISVIDIPNLDSPQNARLVAYLGARQDVGQSATCTEVQQ